MKNRESDKKNEPIQNGWEFMARYWWIILPIGEFLSWFISALIEK